MLINGSYGSVMQNLVLLSAKNLFFLLCYLTNTGHSPKAVSMLAHRLRRWPNIETALGECPVFAG